MKPCHRRDQENLLKLGRKHRILGTSYARCPQKRREYFLPIPRLLQEWGRGKERVDHLHNPHSEELGKGRKSQGPQGKRTVLVRRLSRSTTCCCEEEGREGREVGGRWDRYCNACRNSRPCRFS